MGFPKTMKKSISIISHNKRTTTKNRARGKELMQVDYKEAHKGSIQLLLTTGSTDIQYSALCNEYNW